MKPVAVALLLLLASPQEKVTLKVNLKAGDTYEASQSSTEKITVTVAEQKIKTSAKGRLRQIWKIKDVKDGRIAKAEVETTEEVAEAEVPGMGSMKENGGLHATKFTVNRAEGGTKYEGAESVHERDRGRVDPDLWAVYFPPGPVGVGESWEVKGDLLKRVLSNKETDVTAAKASCTLKSVGDVEGTKCAVVTVKLQTKSTIEKQGMSMTNKADLEGEVTISLDRGVPLATKFTGTVSFANDDGTMEGSGTISVQETIKVK